MKAVARLAGAPNRVVAPEGSRARAWLALSECVGGARLLPVVGEGVEVEDLFADRGAL
jgi:hypothetical protein